jgi:NNP family nitrate/nitrite transporter-like MFS transporter
VGMLVDKYGPKIMFSMLLGISSFICFFLCHCRQLRADGCSPFYAGFCRCRFCYWYSHDL